ncbi:MAG: TonB-dependent receptor [Bacteroidaceae bacterium]
MKKRLTKMLFLSLFFFGTGCTINKVFAESPDFAFVSENKKVSGDVVDDNGEPLIGVSVLVEGTTNGVITDFDGKFKVDVPIDKKILIFSYIGYKEQKINVTDNMTLHVIMKEDNQQLDEVVVVGYGTQKKANLSGAVSSVGSDALQNKPIVSAGQGLQGVIPNLNISIKSGDPSESPTYNIRGNTSINGGGPLVLVDGVPMNVDNLNPNDIKSVTVLKDAGAAAIYGARAAFGVILVETKSASEGKVRITFNTDLILQNPIYNMEPLTDPYKYVTNYNIARERNQMTPSYNEDYIAAVKAYQDDPKNNPEWAIVNGKFQLYGNNNYRDRVMKDYSPMQKYDLSLSGSSQKNKYYISFGFMDSKGFYKGDHNEDYKRYNIIMKNDIEINDWITADSKIIYNGIKSDKVHSYGNDSNLNTFSRVAPIRSIVVPRIPGYENMEGMYFFSLNMLPILESGGRDILKNNSVWLTQGLTLNPMKGLKLRSDFSYQTATVRQDIDSRQVLMANTVGLFDGSTNSIYSYGKTANDYVSVVTQNNQYYVINAYAEYTKKIKTHDFKVMVGYNQEWSKNTSATATANGIITNGVIDLNATNGLQQVKGGKNDLALMGYFYRFNYSYNDIYLLECNGRYDGTSRFPSDSRFGLFPSFSAAWRVSNEKFMEGTRDFLDNLKIRASYGVLGNQALSGYYPYISSMAVGTSNYQFDNSGYSSVISTPGLVSSSLTWESVVTTNFGLDFTAFDQRLDVSADVYKRKTKDMLMGVSYPSTLGGTSPKENGADLETTGWELAIKWRDHIGEKFNYDLTLSLSDYQAEITKYNNPTGNINTFYEGKKLGEIWGFKTEGIFQSDEEIASAPSQSQLNNRWIPGDIRFANLNDDNVISRGKETLDDHGDLMVIGNTTPRYSYGINLNMNYKNWSVGMFFQGVMKRDYYPSNNRYTWFFPYMGENIETYWLDECWSETNRDAYFPGPLLNNNKNYVSQTRFLQNAAYCRLKNLSISYNVPKCLLNKIGLESVRIGVAGSNLLTFSSIHKPLDPEYIFSGNIDYPLMQTYSANLSVTF